MVFWYFHQLMGEKNKSESYFSHFLDPPTKKVGPIDLPPFICLFVCLFVRLFDCTELLSKTGHREKSGSFKNYQHVFKIGFFDFSWKPWSLILCFYCCKWQRNVCVNLS